MFDRLDALFDRLAIGPAPPISDLRESFYHQVAVSRARELLRWEADTAEQGLFETRIRLAVHLSPRSAINFDPRSPETRWSLIYDYLAPLLLADEAELESLARDVQAVLDLWDASRESVTTNRNYLVQRDGPKCQNCQVRFGDDPESLIRADEYKPFFRAPDDLLRPEVDHIESISTLGDNASSNLQLLCRLCNGGKGRGLGLEVDAEVRFAGFDIAEIPIPHRAKLLYYVIHRDGRTCTRCVRSGVELTIRPINAYGALARSNLRTICYECTDD